MSPGGADERALLAVPPHFAARAAALLPDHGGIRRSLTGARIGRVLARSSGGSFAGDSDRLLSAGDSLCAEPVRYSSPSTLWRESSAAVKSGIAATRETVIRRAQRP